MKIVRSKNLNECRVKAFEGVVPLDLECAVKKVELKNEADVLIDFRDVVFEGYASTWGNLDRDGDIMRPGAFSKSIKEFLRNPIALKDHRQSVDSIVGHFAELREDKKGLFVRCKISNAPDCQSIRFKVAEGSLRAMSVAGLMYYNESGIDIFEVKLWEISLVAVPANPEALVDTVLKVRDMTDVDFKRFSLEPADSRMTGTVPAVKKRETSGILIPELNLTIS